MVKVKLEGFESTLKRLKQVEINTRNISHDPEALRAVGVLLSAAAKKRITEGGLPPFEPLNTATLKRRRGGGEGGKILMDTGIGRRSVTTEVQGVELFYVLNKYMAIQNFGFQGIVSIGVHRRKVKSRNVTRGKKKSSGVAFVKAHTRKMNLPARPFLGVLNAKEQVALGEIVARRIL